MQETKGTQVRSLGRGDPLEEEMAAHSCLGSPADRGAAVHGVAEESDTTEAAEHARISILSGVFVRQGEEIHGLTHRVLGGDTEIPRGNQRSE